MVVLSIVDRIAANIAMAAGDYPWDEQSDETKEAARNNAIAVLEDIFDPPAAMVEAGAAADEHPVGTHNPFNIWQAMVTWAIDDHYKSNEAAGAPAAEGRSVENAVRNILAGMDRKGAIGVSLDRKALEAMLDPAGNAFEVEFIGGDKS